MTKKFRLPERYQQAKRALKQGARSVIFSRPSRKIMNSLVSDTLGERAARKAAERKLKTAEFEIKQDWKKHNKGKDTPKLREYKINDALRAAADAAFKPIDEAKTERVMGDFKDAMSGAAKSVRDEPTRALAKVIVGASTAYVGAKLAKYAHSKIAPAVRNALVKVRAYSRNTRKGRAISVKQHWRKAWKRRTQESSTAFGALMRSDVRAVRKIKRVSRKVCRITGNA